MLEIRGLMIAVTNGRVLLPKGAAEPGSIVEVTITAADDYELEGSLATAKAKPEKA